MDSGFIYLNQSKIHYLLIGKGKELVVCFHGFEEKAKSFLVLEALTSSRYTLIAIDLPSHGETIWLEEKPLTAPVLIEILDMIPALTNCKFSLLGFSMGGRVALSIYQYIPGRIPQLVLFAPDGLKMNFWYWLVTQTRAGNRLFKFTMKNPGWLFSFMRMLKTLGLINESVYKFSFQQMNQPKSRLRLYHIWTAMRLFKPDMWLIKKLIVKNQTSLKLIYGRHDRIIRWERGEKIFHSLKALCSIHVLNCGHQVLHEHNAVEIVNILED
jgi:pimeloyl-ACP methyl ester carboxylesterase